MYLESSGQVLQDLSDNNELLGILILSVQIFKSTEGELTPLTHWAFQSINMGYLPLYWVFITLVINYHRIYSLKQHKFIILQLCRSKVRYRSLQAKNQDGNRVVFFSGAQRKNVLPSVFPCLKLTHNPMLMALSLSSKLVDLHLSSSAPNAISFSLTIAGKGFPLLRTRVIRLDPSG